MILPSEDLTVATRSFVHLCDPNAVTLPLRSTPLEPTITHETPARFGTHYISPVSGHSPGPTVLSPQLPLTHTTRPEIYNIIILQSLTIVLAFGDVIYVSNNNWLRFV